jgi:hypothetical protein
LGERLLCKQEVDGSIPFTSTKQLLASRSELSTDREKKRFRWRDPSRRFVL